MGKDTRLKKLVSRVMILNEEIIARAISNANLNPDINSLTVFSRELSNIIDQSAYNGSIEITKVSFDMETSCYDDMDCHASFYRDETDEEMEIRLEKNMIAAEKRKITMAKRNAKIKAKKEEKDRKTYERLRHKFEKSS